MEYDKENQWWIEYTKLSSGQTAVIMFSKYPRGKTLYYFVTFGIADKKKMLRNWLLETGSGDLCTKCTGKCGADYRPDLRRHLLPAEHNFYKTGKRIPDHGQ